MAVLPKQFCSFTVALRPQRPCGPWGTKSPGRPPRLSHSSRALNSLYFISPFICPAHAGLHCVRLGSRYTEVSTPLWRRKRTKQRPQKETFAHFLLLPWVSFNSHKSNLTVKLQLHYTFDVKLQVSSYDSHTPWGGVKEGLWCACFYVCCFVVVFHFIAKPFMHEKNE